MQSKTPALRTRNQFRPITTAARYLLAGNTIQCSSSCLWLPHDHKALLTSPNSHTSFLRLSALPRSLLMLNLRDSSGACNSALLPGSKLALCTSLLRRHPDTEDIQASTRKINIGRSCERHLAAQGHVHKETLQGAKLPGL